jgi:hypothetical protein
MTVERLKEETTYRGLLRWKAYFAREVNFFHREDYYAAQLISLIKTIFSKEGNEVPVEASLLKFGPGKPERPEKPRRARSRAQAREEYRTNLTEQAKARWFSVCGYKPAPPNGKG